MNRLLLFVCVLGLSAACSESPETAYERMVFQAKMGNEEGFLEGFTERSQRLMKSMLALRRTYGAQSSEEADPYLALVMDKVTKVEKSTAKTRVCNGTDNVETEVAVLTVTNDDEVFREIKMYECEDGWKIDALKLQKDWKGDSDDSSEP